MRITPYQFLSKLLWFALIFSFSSCLPTQKIDLFIADQYNNQIPKIDKKKNPEITLRTILKILQTFQTQLKKPAKCCHLLYIGSTTTGVSVL